MEKRSKEIKIRLFPEEHQALLKKSGKVPLAIFLRDLGLGQKDARKKSYPKVDPELLRQLSGIGNNLNQLARIANIKRDEMETALILSALSDIKASLDSIEKEFTW